ncbi:major outer membrane protein [Verrucomicrobiota bacterium]
MKQMITVVLLSVLLCATVYAEDAQSIADVFTMGKHKADVGLNFRSTWEDRDDGKDDEGHLGWLYAEFGFETAPLSGVKVGASCLSVAETWGSDIYDNEFGEDSDTFKGHWFTDGDVKHLIELKNLYLNYSIPNTKSELLIGRKKFKKVALMDGDVQEGVQLKVGDIPQTKLYVGMITGWEDDISQSWDLDGVEDFTRDADDTVDSATNSAGDAIYTCIADVDVVEKRLKVTPFVVHHPDFLTTYGALAKASMPVNDDVTLGIDGGWAEFSEQTDVTTDEDAQTWKIHASAKVDKCYVGVGYFRVSDDPDALTQSAGAKKTVGNYHWEPIKVGKVGLYAGGKGGDPDDSTIWVDAGFDVGKFSLDVIFGSSSFYNVKKKVDQDSIEIDAIASYKFTSSFSGSLGWLHQEFDDNDAEKDRDFIMGGAKYSL